MIRYRYASTGFNMTDLNRTVPGLPTVELVSSPVTINVTVAASYKQDLDDYLVANGWKYIGTVDEKGEVTVDEKGELNVGTVDEKGDLNDSI